MSFVPNALKFNFLFSIFVAAQLSECCIKKTWGLMLRLTHYLTNQFTYTAGNYDHLFLLIAPFGAVIKMPCMARSIQFNR